MDTTSWSAYLQGAPSAVVAPPAATPGDGATTLSWHSAANHGSPITAYVVTPYLNGVAQGAQTFSTNASSDVVTGLENGGSYTFTVAAENAVGTGTASAMSTGIVVGVPLAPSAPRAVRPAAHTLRVSFSAAVDNGAPVSLYRARCVSPDGGVTRSASAAHGPVTVAGLTPAVLYRCIVTAQNGRGTGAPSTPTAIIRA